MRTNRKRVLPAVKAILLIAALFAVGNSRVIPENDASPEREHKALDDPRANFTNLLSIADNLYRRETTILDAIPTTEDEADRLSLTIGKQWLKDENAFQASLVQMSKDQQVIP